MESGNAEITDDDRIVERSDGQRRGQLVQDLHKQKHCYGLRFTSNKKYHRDQTDSQINRKQDAAGRCSIAVTCPGPIRIDDDAGADWNQDNDVEHQRKCYHEPHRKTPGSAENLASSCGGISEFIHGLRRRE